MNEEHFIEWFAQYQSDCEEARADIEERLDELLLRTELEFDDPKVAFLRDYLFTDYQPL